MALLNAHVQIDFDGSRKEGYSLHGYSVFSDPNLAEGKIIVVAEEELTLDAFGQMRVTATFQDELHIVQPNVSQT